MCLDRSQWKDEKEFYMRAEPNGGHTRWIRTICFRCGRFMGYRRFDGDAEQKKLKRTRKGQAYGD